MLKLILCGSLFCSGLLALYETTLPVSKQTVQVRSRSMQEEQREDDYTTEPTYTLHFYGGQPSMCSVSETGYERAREGDSLEVTYTRMLKQCVLVTRGSEVLYASAWKTKGVLLGLLFIAFSLVLWRRDE